MSYNKYNKLHSPRNSERLFAMEEQPMEWYSTQNTKNNNTSKGNATKNHVSHGGRAFDLSSWIQHGALCKNSCYNQIKHDLIDGNTSITSSTVGSSSLNDSFDDVSENTEYLLPRTKYHSTGAQIGHRYTSSEESLHSLNFSSLDISATLGKQKHQFTASNRPSRNTVAYTQQHNTRRSRRPSPKTHKDKPALMPQQKRQRVWKSAIDSKSGRRYYYDVNTRQTQWQKPLELASKSERHSIKEKEQQQKDFFKTMERNILKSMNSGHIPGPLIVNQEDTIKSLPKPSVSRSKPLLLRTISSMDHELLQELTNVETETKKAPTATSPDIVTTTTFSESLPQPGGRELFKNIPSLASTSTSSSSSFDNYETKVTSPVVPKPELAKRNNTCGTMYVVHTMADPDKDGAIKCVSGVYRTHIINSINDSSTRTKFAEYEIFNDVYDHTTRKPFIRQRASIVEADFGIELQYESYRKQVPSLDEITDYFRFIFNKAQLEHDCIIMSLIYVERILRETNGGVRPNLDNWKSLLFSCMIMASKVWDDMSMWNVDFSQACPSGVRFTLQRINELELAVLSCLKYNVKVPASEYAKYYFLMRSMLIRSGLAGDEFRSSKPLDMEGAKKLEVISAAYKAKPVKPGYIRRSKSLDVNSGDDSKSHVCKSSTQVKLEQLVAMQHL